MLLLKDPVRTKFSQNSVRLHPSGSDTHKYLDGSVIYGFPAFLIFTFSAWSRNGGGSNSRGKRGFPVAAG